MAFLFYPVAGRTLVETAYDEFGRESQLTYGNGNTTTYSYDERHQVTSVTSTGDKNSQTTYKYDAKGNIIERNGEHNNYKYLYDILGRLTSAYGREGHELSVEYDSFNRVISFKNYIDGEGYETRYTYNNIKGIIEKTNSKNTAGESVFEKVYSYDDLGRMAEYVYNTEHSEGEEPFTVKFEFLAGEVEGETTTTTLVKKLSVNGVVYEYSYDSLGNITEVAKTVGETTTVIQSYVYDSLNQLIRENNKETNETVVYTYDNHGNILSKTVYPFTLGEIVSEGTTVNYGYDSTWTDLLINYNGQAISYDQIGNPLSYRDGMSFKWSAGRKLTSFTLNNGASYVNGSYVYDDSGIRVYKNINGNETKYYLNGSTIQTEITNFGGATRRIDYIYDEAGSIYGFSVDNKDYYYYVKNLQGDIIGILDKSGNLLVEYVYDAYGVPTVSFPGITETTTDAEKNAIYLLGNNNPFRYRGYYFDVESGLYYLNSRYYDPVTGRFINADSQISGVGGEVLGYNLFAYCQNNPVNLLDVTGNWPKWVSGALNVVGGALQVAVGAALGATVGWTGVGAVVAGFLIVNGTATVLQGVGQIVNDATNSNIMREDNIVRTGVQEVGRAIGGDTGANIAGGIYDGTVLAASFYAGSVLKCPEACFVAGTVVLTDAGEKAIEEIAVGDLVWSKNTETGEQALKEVVQIFVRESKELVYVSINGKEIVTTPEHPFYVMNQGWVCAIDLHVGDTLVLQNGKCVKIEKTQLETQKLPVTVYNFEVEDFHTYYVGDESVLVHNSCKPIGRQIGKAPRSNQAQNRQFNSVVKEFNLSPKQQRILHEAITGLGYSRDEIIDEVISLFPEIGRR